MEFDNKSPIYLQIIGDLKKRIFAGELPPGDKLPSVRDLALNLGINPNTAQKALAKLEEEGYLITSRTNGRFVTDDTDFIRRHKKTMAITEVKKFLDQMEAMGFGRSDVLALISGMEEERGFAQSEPWQKPAVTTEKQEGGINDGSH